MNFRANVLLFLLVIFVGCEATTKSKPSREDAGTSFVRNGKVSYKIVLLSCDTCVPIVNRGFRVITDIGDEERTQLKGVATEEWIRLLMDEGSDFCANVLLYEMFDRSAASLYFHNGIPEWRKYMKNDDIEFWKLHLR